jgi:ADP-ribose pyrophosphatase
MKRPPLTSVFLGGGVVRKFWPHVGGPIIVGMNRPVQTATPYQGKLFQVQVLKYTDNQGRELTREVVRHPGAVLIVPVLDDRTLVMIRNYRIAPDETLWEFPAGKLEPAEDPLAAAHRELEEETGYRAGKIWKIGEFYTSPGFADELMRVFVAEQLTYAGQRLEAGEDIVVQNIDRDDAMAMVHDGRLRDGKSIAGLLMWDHHRRTHASERVTRGQAVGS